MEQKKNYIEQITNMFDLKINEEFKLRLTDYGRVIGKKEIDKIFRFDTELVYKGYNDGCSEWYGFECDKVFYGMLLGSYEVVRS